MRHVSVDVVTGFLGSGKTTLLQYVLAGSLAGERVAVVMNELGELGIDGRTISNMQYAENVVELNSGCICCTIEDARFDLAIQELVERVDPTLVVIETTGVADPEPLAYRIEQSGLALDAVICVVDAENFEATLSSASVVGAQVRAADFLVLNKVDLVSVARRNSLRKKLVRLNRRALLLESERGRVDHEVLFATSPRRFRTAAAEGRPVEHLRNDGIGCFSHRSSLPLDRGRFEKMLSKLPADVYRAKGFVQGESGEWGCLFNYTCGRSEFHWVRVPGAQPGTQAVFIGRDIEKMEARIRSALSRCEVSRTR